LPIRAEAAGMKYDEWYARCSCVINISEIGNISTITTVSRFANTLMMTNSGNHDNLA